MLVRELLAVDSLVNANDVPAVAGFDQFRVQAFLEGEDRALEFVDGLAFADLAEAASLVTGFAGGVLFGQFGELGAAVDEGRQ